MERWTGVILGVVAGLVYFVVGPDQIDTDSHWPIAQAFVAGRLHLVDAIPWVELVPRPDGGWFSPFPPLLSVLLMPFAIVGIPIWTDASAAVAGGISVALMWALLGRLDVAQVPRVALALAWAFGSEMLWVAGTGGQHLAPQAIAAALLLGSMLLGLYADGKLQHVGVSASFTEARRAELLEELKPLEVEIQDHPWGEWQEWAIANPDRVPGTQSRWSQGKDLSFTPLRPERVLEVGYEHMEGRRFRHTAQFKRWRTDRDPESCGYEQLEEIVSYDLGEVLSGGH